MGKKYDLVVKVGEYQKDGQTKAKNKNIGVVMESDYGMYIIMDRTFNPAGVPNPDGKESIFISMYEPRQNDGYNQSNQQSQSNQVVDDLDDTVPF